MKILADEQGKIIGAQAIGHNASEKVNILATAIMAGMNIKDLQQIEYAYCPAVCDSFDPINMVADILAKKLARLK